MSFYQEKPTKSTSSARLMSVLLTLVVCLAVLLVVVRLIISAWEWWRTRNYWSWLVSTPTDQTQELSYAPFQGLLKTNLGDLATIDRPVTLNLDPNLLTASQAATPQWLLQLNVDGEWEKISNWQPLKSLTKAAPIIWENKFVYQDNQQRISAFDLNLLEELPIMDLELAGQILAQQEVPFVADDPTWQLVLSGAIEDKLFIYLTNQNDDGLMLMGQIDDGWWQWQVWPGLRGRLAQAAGQQLLIQGVNGGCGNVYTFNRLSFVADQPQWQRLASVADGCVSGDRYLGFDDQGRLLLGQPQDQNATQLVYQDLWAVPITQPEQKVRVLIDQDFPVGITDITYFPAHEVDDDRWPAKTILTSDQTVWQIDNGGVLQALGYLNNQFGRLQALLWLNQEELCLRSETSQLTNSERWVILNTTTGTPIQGSAQCEQAWQLGEGQRAGQSQNWSAQTDFEMAKELALPADYRLVQVDHQEQIIFASQEDEAEVVLRPRSGLSNLVD